MGLTRRRQVFVEEYLTCWNAAEAARRAGYSERTAYSMGPYLLKNIEVEALIRQRISEKTMTADEVLIRLGEHARCDIGDFYDPATNTVDMRRARSQNKTRLIKKVKQTVRTSETEEVIFTEIELVDSQAALVHLGRHHKLFTDVQENRNQLNVEGLDELLDKIWGDGNEPDNPGG